MDISTIYPELVVLGAGLVLLLVARFIHKGSFSALWTILAAIGALGVSYWVYSTAGPQTGFGGAFALDGYSQFFNVLFCINLALAACLSLGYIAADKAPMAEYYTLLLLATTGAMTVASALDLMTLYLGLELMALSTCVLVGITRDADT